MKARQGKPDFPALAKGLAARAIGIDSHIDTIQRVLVMGEDLGIRHDEGHVDFPRLREGGMKAPFFALWVPVFFRGAEAVRRTLDPRDAVQSLLDTYKNEIELATTARDICRVVKQIRSRHFCRSKVGTRLTTIFGCYGLTTGWEYGR